MNTEESTSNQGRDAVMPYSSATSATSEAANISSPFGPPVTDPHQFQFPQIYPNVSTAEHSSTTQPAQAPQCHPPTFTTSYPPYMNFPHAPYHNMPPMSFGFPFYPFPSQAQQPSSTRSRLLAPKPPQDTQHTSSCDRSTVAQQPLDFIETVQTIRLQLYQKAGLNESDELLVVKPEVYTRWRKEVINSWKPVSPFIC